MELLKEILINLLEKEEINITFPNVKIDVTEIIIQKNYQALEEIRTIIEGGNSLVEESDIKIERIVSIFEQLIGERNLTHYYGKRKPYYYNKPHTK